MRGKVGLGVGLLGCALTIGLLAGRPSAARHGEAVAARAAGGEALLPLALAGLPPAPPAGWDCRDFGHPCGLQLARTSAFDASPGVTMTKWAFLVNGLSTGNAQPLVLTVPGDVSQAGTGITLAPMAAGARGQLWYAGAMSQDGPPALWSAVGDAAVLSVDLNQPAPVPAVLYPSQGPATSQVTGAADFQAWHYDPGTGYVTNEVAAGRLNASAAGAAIVLSDASGPGAAWETWPSYPLGALLEQPSTGFPDGSTPGQVCAYDYISDQVNVGQAACTVGGGQHMTGVRCEYTNMNKDLGTLKTDVNNVRPPAFGQPFSGCSTGLTRDDWNAVTGQLNAELTAGEDVRDLFQNMTTFYSEVFIDDGDLLGKLIVDAGLSDSDKAHAAALPFVEGVVYTVLSAAGPVAGVVGNLMETATNTASAKGGLDTQYFVAVSELYGNLVTGFNSVLTALGDMETEILSDWGKLSAVEGLINASGPDSLAWPANNNFLAAANDGYTAVAMQSLLPVTYSLYRIVGQTDGTVAGTLTYPAGAPVVSDQGQWAQKVADQTVSQYSLWNHFAVQTQWLRPPSADALADVFDSGVSPEQFFNGTNGWEGFSRYDSTATSTAATVCNVALVEFENRSNRTDLVLSVDPGQGRLGGNGQDLTTDFSRGSGGGTRDAVAIPLLPYGKTMVAGAFNGQLGAGGLEFDVTVKDSCATIQTLTLHQHDCNYVEPDDTWVDNMVSVPGCDSDSFPFGYTVTPQNQGQDSAGAVSFALYPPNQPTPSAPPTVSRVSPNQGHPGQDGLVVRVYGDFVLGASCDFGPGISLGPQGCQGTTTTLEAVIDIAADASLGCRDVTITNPGNGQAVLSCGFVVHEDLGSLRPNISALTPDSSIADQSLQVTISGGGFVEGTTCDFGPVIQVTACNFINPNTLTAHLTIPAGATPGPVDVTVTDPRQPRQPASASFTILGLPVALYSVTPFTGTPGQRMILTLVGANFQPGASCGFGPSSGITVNACTGVPGHESRLLSADISIAADAKGGFRGRRTLTVTNPDGQSAGHFYFVRYPGSPIVSDVSPRQVQPGQDVTVTLSGYGFSTPSTCEVAAVDWDTGQPLPGGITVRACTVDSPNQITMPISVDPSAAFGPRIVGIVTPSSYAIGWLEVVRGP